jgi:hypothetical protein
MTTIQDIDAALMLLPATPKTDEELEARATLMRRRGDLENAARAEAAASRQKQRPRGDLVINVPRGVGISHLYGQRGRVCCSRLTEDGRLVMDLFVDEFRILLSDRTHGLAWHNANGEALQRLGEMAR